MWGINKDCTDMDSHLRHTHFQYLFLQDLEEIQSFLDKVRGWDEVGYKGTEH